MSDKLRIIIDNYGSANAPTAAKFGAGASTQAEIEEATAARSELSDQQSNPGRGPVRRDR